MGSAHPTLTRGHYYYGEETVAANDMSTIQYYSHVTSGRVQNPSPSNSLIYNREPSNSSESYRIYDNNGSIDAPGSSSRSYLRNFHECESIGASPNNGYGVPVPNSSPFSQNVHRHGSSILLSPHINSFHLYEGNNVYDYNNVRSCPRNVQGRGIRIITPPIDLPRSYGGTGARHGVPVTSFVPLAGNVQGHRSSMTDDSFQRFRGIGVHLNNANGGVSAPSFSSQARNIYGVPTNSFGRYRPMGASYNNDYNYVMGPSNVSYTQNSRDGRSTANTPQNISTFEFRPYGGNDYNGISEQTIENARNAHGCKTLMNDRAPTDQNFIREPMYVRERCNPDNLNYIVNETSIGKVDQSINNERSKLIFRIKKCFKLNAPSAFEENSLQFDKEDWIEVWCSFSDGMKVYHAKMWCPICGGTVSPQNKEKEPGKLPKWHLFSVKRHVEEIHAAEPFDLKARMPKLEQETKRSTSSESLVEETIKQTDKPKQKCKTTVQNKDDTSSESSDKSEQESDVSSNLDSDADNKKRKKVDNGKRKRRKIDTENSSESHSDDEKLKERNPPKPKALNKKSGKIDTNESSSDSSSSGTESRQAIPVWRKRGVKFGWVKTTVNSRFQPAFIFPKRLGEKKKRAQYIQAKGALSDSTYLVEEEATPEQLEAAKKLKKSTPYLSAIKEFNAINKTKY